jgi:hypothetical protein
VVDADRVGDDGEQWIDRAAAGEEAGVDDVKILEVVCFAVDVEDGLFWVGIEGASAALGPTPSRGMRFLNRRGRGRSFRRDRPA